MGNAATDGTDAAKDAGADVNESDRLELGFPIVPFHPCAPISI